VPKVLPVIEEEADEEGVLLATPGVLPPTTVVVVCMSCEVYDIEEVSSNE
jgi:hypothetical protein